MATERRPYHLTADAVWHEPWDNDTYAFIGRLSALMHERWRTSRLTAEEASVVRVGPTDLQKLAGKRRLDVALTSARRAADVVTMSVERSGDVFTITWPKWSEFQKLTTQTGGRPGGNRSPSASIVHRPALRPPIDPPQAGGGLFAREPAGELPKPRSPTALARAAWPALQAAAAQHGARWGALGAAREKIIAARIADGATCDDLVAAIHGAVRGWKASKGFEWRSYVRPSTIFQRSKFADYADAGRTRNGVAPARHGEITFEEVKVT